MNDSTKREPYVIPDDEMWMVERTRALLDAAAKAPISHPIIAALSTITIGIIGLTAQATKHPNQFVDPVLQELLKQTLMDLRRVLMKTDPQRHELKKLMEPFVLPESLDDTTTELQRVLQLF